MPRIAYMRKNLGAPALAIIAAANRVLDDYEAQGFDLTLRQLYYQFVGHDLFPEDRTWLWLEDKRRWLKVDPGTPGSTKNADPNYKWLGDIVNSGRLSGRIDWNRIIDRTRKVKDLAHWETPAEMMEQAAKQYRVSVWEEQPKYVEVWIEKDALVGVIKGVCERFDVPFFSCRGYTSQSEMWSAGQRLGEQLALGKEVTILHLGDHDPSGIDMTRDIEDRLSMFIGKDAVLEEARVAGMKPRDMSKANREATVAEVFERFHVRRVALNMEQVETYRPPPNPAKLTDSRFESYLREYGPESWELDALEPRVLEALIETHVESLIDWTPWEDAQARQSKGRRLMERASERWDELSAQLEEDA